jgi:dTDP-4-dehydrorhamnose 3,5-epimerase
MDGLQIMQFEPTEIPDVVLIRPKVFGDPRGFFLESWEEQKFASAGLDVKFVQDNHSRSACNILRGLHYQAPRTQGKLVRVVTGSVFDVAVDIRRSSPTFGRWIGVVLSDENHAMLWVPPGFAHGFLVLSESADFLYRCTDFWVPAHERAIIWNDPDLKIDWPLPPGVEPRLSEKDARAVRFRDAECLP